ncbi:PREDICTED: uncharacterized protein LOC108364153 [Rhagoletis zephyria]|uniref:uncharacterized protein LOC108364153 n=1 Tax=Rhagoletis zephyria TaxID=28612 RepID=UPI000811A52B|nr:PREDICTED: uncharacterized protein LOC108364153 [Rhagoletis zephyria]
MFIIKVFAAVLVATAILHPAIAASLAESADAPEAPNSLEVVPLARAVEIDERAKNFLNVKNWNENAIDKRYSAEDLPALAFALNNIYSGDAASFKKMVTLQLYLFGKFDDKGDVNDEYVLNVAHYFAQIKKNKLHSKLSSNLKNTLNDYIGYLPPSLDYLFFQSSFCLLNRKHLKYLYTTDMHIDSQRDYVFIWDKDSSNNQNKGAYTTTVNDVSSNRQTKLKFTLKNVKSKRYAYLERNSYNGKRNLLASWHAVNQKPSNAEWTVSLYQNQLIFSQNGRVICASDSLYDQSRRYVYGLDEDGEDKAACQWYAKDCP